MQRQIAGDLTIDNGCTVNLESLSITNPTVIGVIVLGNIINNGTVNMSTTTERLKCSNFINNSTGTATMSSSSGGDIEVTGNLVDSGTFNANTRAVFFTGTGTQDVSGSGTFNIDYIVMSKASGSVRMLNNLLCEGPNGGNAITLTSSTDILDLNGKTLTLGKAGVTSTISGSGFIKGSSASSLIIQGTGSFGTFNFDQTTDGSTNVLLSFTMNRTSTGTATLGNKLNIVAGGIVTITAGTITTGGNLRLKSTASGTASIANSAGSISGNVNVERYISASGRKYRFLSSPVTSATIANWMDSIWVTGPGDSIDANRVNGTTLGTLNSNGWHTSIANINYPTSGGDIKSVKYTSIRTYDESNSANNTNIDSGFSNVTTTQSLTPGQGFKVFVRGPRKVGGISQTDQLGGAGSFPSQNAVTLLLTGTVNQGDITLNGSTSTAYKISKSTQGWNLIGNPYPCAYDIKAHYTGNTNSLGTNINPTIYIYNASTSGYASYNPTGSGTASGSGLSAGIIPSGSAFFIQASSASPVFTFKEANKTTTAPGVLHKADDIKTDQFEIKYYKDSVESDYLTVKLYDGSTLDYDMYDIYKLRNDNLNLSAYGQDSLQLAATVIPPTSEETHIKLNVEASLIGTYKFDFNNMTNFEKEVSVSLFDRYTNKTTDVRANTTYTFDMGPGVNQWGKNRFELILNAKSTTTGIASENSILNTRMFVYPNPANEILNINLSNSNFNNSKVSIYHLSGDEVLNSVMASNSTQLNIDGLSHGLYFVKVSNENGFNKTMKFVK